MRRQFQCDSPRSPLGRHSCSGHRDSTEAICDDCKKPIIRSHTRSAWWAARFESDQASDETTKRKKLVADLEEYAEACVDAYRGCGQRFPSEQEEKAARVLAIFNRIVARVCP